MDKGLFFIRSVEEIFHLQFLEYFIIIIFSDISEIFLLNIFGLVRFEALYHVFVTVMWIRIRSDPHSYGSVDPNPDPEVVVVVVKSFLRLQYY